MNLTMTGFAELEAKLLDLAARDVRGAARKALSAGARIIKQAIKSQIPAQYKEARKAIGSSVKVNSNGDAIAKIGGAVGMKANRAAKAGADHKANRGKRPGVGISANNIDWLLKGTDARFTGERRVGRKGKKVRTGRPRHFTGRMRPLGAVIAGYMASASLANSAIAETFKTEIEAAAVK